MVGRAIRNLATRQQIAGIIRLGYTDPDNTRVSKAGNEWMPPEADGLLRVSTPSKAIAAALTRERGSYSEWHQREGFYLVELGTNEVDVWLPFGAPDGDDDDRVYSVLNGPLYRMWDDKAKRNVRTCDGVEVMIGTSAQPETASCLCEASRPNWADECTAEEYGGYDGSTQRWRQCKMVTELVVVIPDVPMEGVFRVSTKSEDAAAKWPGVVRYLARTQQADSAATLRLVKRMGYDDQGKAKSWYEPLLVAKQTALEITGRAAPAIAAAPPPAHTEPPALETPAVIPEGDEWMYDADDITVEEDDQPALPPTPAPVGQSAVLTYQAFTEALQTFNQGHPNEPIGMRTVTERFRVITGDKTASIKKACEGTPEQVAQAQSLYDSLIAGTFAA